MRPKSAPSVMLPSGPWNCEWLKTLKSSPRNSSLQRSLSCVTFWKPISQLLIPGPQHTVRGALPIVPGATVASVKLLFGSNPALIGWQSTPVPDDGPVPNAHTVFFGLIDLNGATTLGSPGVSKSKLDCSSMSSCSVMRTGKPAWNVVIPETAQPLRALPAKPSYFGT